MSLVGRFWNTEDGVPDNLKLKNWRCFAKVLPMLTFPENFMLGPWVIDPSDIYIQQTQQDKCRGGFSMTLNITWEPRIKNIFCIHHLESALYTCRILTTTLLEHLLKYFVTWNLLLMNLIGHVNLNYLIQSCDPPKSQSTLTGKCPIHRQITYTNSYEVPIEVFGHMESKPDECNGSWQC